MFTGENFEVEVKPGKFKVERTATNMIAFAIDSGEDKDGVWVETWGVCNHPEGPGHPDHGLLPRGQ